MSKHAQIVTTINDIKGLPQNARKMDSDNKVVILRSLLHAADISNSSRPFNLAKAQAESIFCEFFN